MTGDSGRRLGDGVLYSGGDDDLLISSSRLSLLLACIIGGADALEVL